jgi:hypothetical protein
LGKERKNKHATYTAGYDPGTGRVVVGCSSDPSGCAERDVERQLGRGPKVPIFTKAFGWRKGKWVEIPICVRCQSRYSRKQFPPDVTWDKGGSW